jgi:hypothetical protein
MAATSEREILFHDDYIDEAEAAELESGSAARNLFDLRTIIGGVFTVYGVYLTIYGILDGPAAIRKAAGVRINLWTGLGMLVLGLSFLLWVKLRPLKVEELVAAGEDEEACGESMARERQAAKRFERDGQATGTESTSRSTAGSARNE